METAWCTENQENNNNSYTFLWDTKMKPGLGLPSVHSFEPVTARLSLKTQPVHAVAAELLCTHHTDSH